MNITLILFLIGILGFVLNRKNIILMLISIEIMLSILLLILESYNNVDLIGPTFNPLSEGLFILNLTLPLLRFIVSGFFGREVSVSSPLVSYYFGLRVILFVILFRLFGVLLVRYEYFIGFLNILKVTSCYVGVNSNINTCSTINRLNLFHQEVTKASHTELNQSSVEKSSSKSSNSKFSLLSP